MADFNGPIFNGMAELELVRLCDDIEDRLGSEGEQMVRAELGRVLQNPTGYYESHIDTQPAGAGIDVTDGGVVYGPWLEGTGSRNRTTRFKGYATFRRVAQALDGRAEAVVEPLVDRAVRRMG